MENSRKKSNRLIHEKSPYLLQHAYNPVDWYPWSEEAFEKAQKEGKPILLSVGYSTCHWCHVMAHESFEDPEVAQLMNHAFVNIKVDREERPDIDNIYMSFCQMATGSGGWPLTVVMTPEKKPFFAGTYFPKRTLAGRMGMMDLIPRILDIWKNNKEEILQSADHITATLKEITELKKGDELNEGILEIAFTELLGSYDKTHGGFGSAPKFPSFHTLQFLLRFWKLSGQDRALDVVDGTLESMRLGGIYDHLGFGFHRYSTDPQWLVPHFEKMLYDQALAAMVYTEAFQASKKDWYRETAQEIFAFVLRDMTSDRGGFFSAQDADSEGLEGKFYLWTENDIRETLEAEEADFIVQIFGIKREGNFPEEATRERTGSNILHLKKPLPDTASDIGLSEKDLKARLEKIREGLFRSRQKRIHPHKDDKILTDWNGLMIASLAKGARVFEDETLLKAAERAAHFMLRTMCPDQSRLFHRYRDGEASIEGYLDDYAFMVWGFIELYEASYKTQYLKQAIALNEHLLVRFWDEEEGGFFMTPDDTKEHIIRPKLLYDGAIPSGNSVSALNLLRLSRITGNSRLQEQALAIEKAFSARLKSSPSSYAHMMSALVFRMSLPVEVVIAGDPGSEDTISMIRALNALYMPGAVVLLRPDEEIPEISSIADFTKELKALDGKATAYICREYRCSLPTTDVDEMLSILNT
jgi:uncharacterized protein YyaL (SSP411 family)